MNKFKRALTVMLSAAAISCLGAAAACSGKSAEQGKTAPDYYKLTFEGKGVDFIMADDMEGFISGGEVKEGLSVNFYLSTGSSTFGTPTVLLNGEELTPDENGLYSFNINKESKVTVEGLGLMHEVSFNKFERVYDEGTDSYVERECRISYLDENGKDLTSVRLEGGSSLKFKVKSSVYYKEGFTLSSNFDVLTPDNDGFYTIENINTDTVVSISGLETDDDFVYRNYLYRTEGIGEFCGDGSAEHPYELSRPIDLYAMAAYVNSAWDASDGYYLAYYKLMNDIDMQGEQLYVAGDNSIETAVFCGEFDGQGHKITNFYITDEVIDQETYDNEYLPYVGLFGFSAAQNKKPAIIKNVNLENGRLELHTAAAKSESAQAGGFLVGFGVGVQITDCTVSGTVIANSDDTYYGYAGGVVGVLQSAYNDSLTPAITHDAFVKNTVTNVSINCTGTIHAAGGIVGRMTSADYSSISYVEGCTALGNVFGSIRAGGIAGMLELYSSVNNCKAVGEVQASNPLLDNDINDKSYYLAYAGGLVGYADTDTVIANSIAQNTKVKALAASGRDYEIYNTSEYGVYLGGGAEAGANATDSLKAVLWGCTTDGDLTENAQVKVTVSGDKQYVNSAIPVVRWYAQQSSLPQFSESAGGRSWGYYFDEELTLKVPFGFVPTRDVTLYCGYADYTEVSGEYFLADAAGKTVVVSLSDDGVMNFRYGAMSYTCQYSYDGHTLVLINCPLAAITYTSQELNGAHFNFAGTVTDGIITVRGIVETVNNSSSDEDKTVTYTAAKVMEDFTYGLYTAAAEKFVFNQNGTAIYTKASGQTINFIYTVKGEDLTLTSSFGDVWTGSVQNGKVVSVNGVELTYPLPVMEADESCVGVWFMPGVREGIEITFYSTAQNDGVFGRATINYAGGLIAEVNAEYKVETVGGIKHVNIYLNDRPYAELTFNDKGTVLSGSCYSMHYAQYYSSVSFYKYDELEGRWNTDSDTVTGVTFNGKGMYDVPAIAATEEVQAFMAVRGAVIITKSGNLTLRGTYFFSEGVWKIELNDGTQYTATISGENVILTDGSGNTITLSK